MKGMIGWIKPGAVDRAVEDVFALLPPGVEMSILTSTHSLSMVNVDHFDAEAYPKRVDEVLDLVGQLDRYARPDVFAVTGDLIQSAMGVTWDRQLRDTLARVTGRPAITSMTAVTDALTRLGARRVAAASPYRPDQNAFMIRYLEEAGFSVVAMEGYACPNIRAIKALPDAAPLELARRVFGLAGEIDAFYMPCPVWRAEPFVESLEQTFGVPVVTNVGSFIWSALSAMGYPSGVKGGGRLLETALG